MDSAGIAFNRAGDTDMIDKKTRAINSLYPDASFTILNDGTLVSATPEVLNLKEETIKAEIDRLDAEDIKTKYQRDRNYPDIGEQLDMLYWDKKNDTKNWEDAIDKVKADNPKPE